MALTCRPEYWERDLRRPQTLSGADIAAIRVEPFDDGELAAFLDLHGHRLDEFPKSLLTVLRVPRLSELAMDLRGWLPEVGEVTREMLYLAEWAHRRHVNTTAGVLEPAEIDDFAKELAARFLHNPASSISRKEILDHLGRHSGWGEQRLHPILSDIIGGHWLQRAATTHCYAINQTVLPYVVGLDLVEQVRGRSEPAAVREAIAAFTDPASGGDFGTQVLRAAAAIALYGGRVHRIYDSRSPSEEVPPIVQCELLAAWLTSQNFGPEDEDEAGRLVGAAPVLFLDVAERLWTDGSYPRTERVLVDAFVRGALQVGAVSLALAKRLPCWVGEGNAYRFRADGVPEPVVAALPDAAKHIERRGWSWPAEGLAEGATALRRNAFAIMSQLDRTAFIPTLVAWAMSHSLCAPAGNDGELAAAWVFRLNRHDFAAANAAALAEAELLERQAGRLGRAAARKLRETLGTRAATGGFAVTAGKAPLLPSRWTRDAQGRLQRKNRSRPLSGSDLKQLGELAQDPAAELAPADVADIVRWIREKAPASLLRPSHTSDIFSNVRLVALRWAPDAWADAINGYALAQAPKVPENASLAGLLTEQDFLILAPEVRERVAEAGRMALADRPASASFRRLDLPFSQLDCAALGLVDKQAADQVALMATWTGGPRFSSSKTGLLAKPDGAALSAALAHLGKADTQASRLAWLGYLSAVDLSEMPDDGFALLTGMAAEEQTSTSAVAALCRCRPRRAAAAFQGIDWQAMSPENRRRVGFVLADRDSGLTVAELAEQIDAATLAYAVAQRGCQPADIILLGQRILTCLGEAKEDDYVALPPEVTGAVTAEAYRLVWHQHREALREALTAAPPGPFSKAQGVVILGLVGAALEEIPGVDASLCWLLENIIPRADPAAALMFAVDGPGIEPLRAERLGNAVTDSALARMVDAAETYGRSEWLIANIATGLASASAADTARALTCAGLLDKTAAADELWRRILAEGGLRGWLAEVRSAAAERYRRHGYAVHWLQRFLSAEIMTRRLWQGSLCSNPASSRRRSVARKPWSWPPVRWRSIGSSIGISIAAHSGCRLTIFCRKPKAPCSTHQSLNPSRHDAV